jgi:isocitrate/isopropylmalate dehydrogenase
MSHIRPDDETTILVLPGDGIGPEIVAATVDILRAADRLFDLSFRYETAEIGFDALKASGTTFPDTVLQKARAADGIILGPVSHNDYPPTEKGGLNPSCELRKHLELFANIRPARTRPGLPVRGGYEFDLVIVRENTEGFYADRSMHLGPGEFMPTPDIALAVRKITRAGSTRIAEMAFSLAAQRRRQVTAVHKANVLRVSDGLFLECTREVAKSYPTVEYSEKIIDAMTALVIRDPSKFDVIVTTNMFGDILSDEVSEIAGGLGMAASLNVGTDHAFAQAQHGSAPDLAGRDAANPTSLIGSAAMLLSWLEKRRPGRRFADAASAIEKALDDIFTVAAHRTFDLGGTLGTRAFAEQVASTLETNVGHQMGRHRLGGMRSTG